MQRGTKQTLRVERKMRDRVDPKERQHVIDRDGECVLFKMDADHRCARIGIPHNPNKKTWLTVDHVKDGPMMGKRAPSDRKHMVAMCLDGNVSVPSKEVRAWQRDYLRKIEP